jgi:hypothetical protein
MKKINFHRELLTALRLATGGKAKRAANILTSNQQQALQGIAGTPFVTRGRPWLWPSQTRLILTFASC